MARILTTIMDFLNESAENKKLPKIIDANFFASFVHPNDFRESKKKRYSAT